MPHPPVRPLPWQAQEELRATQAASLAEAAALRAALTAATDARAAADAACAALQRELEGLTRAYAAQEEALGRARGEAAAAGAAREALQAEVAVVPLGNAVSSPVDPHIQARQPLPPYGWPRR